MIPLEFPSLDTASSSECNKYFWQVASVVASVGKQQKGQEIIFLLCYSSRHLEMDGLIYNRGGREEKGRKNRRSRKAGWERQGHIRKDSEGRKRCMIRP